MKPESEASTDPIQHTALALALVAGLIMRSCTVRPRKSAIKVRGGRARARGAARDARGQFLRALGSESDK